jgi:hypothetical protein
METQSRAQLVGQLLSSTYRIYGEKQSAGTLHRENIIVELLKPFPG